MNERLEASAQLFDAASAELEQAAAHCRTAAGHFRQGEVPRGTAHAWAARGHILAAEESLNAQARQHASRSEP